MQGRGCAALMPAARELGVFPDRDVAGTPNALIGTSSAAAWENHSQLTRAP